MPVFDTHMVLAILGISVVGGILGLDRTAAGQFMLSQPVVVGPLIGWMLGDATTGFLIGAALELIWLLDLPVGSFVPADATIGTVAATGIAVLGMPGGASLAVVGFSLLLTTAIVPLTMWADEWVRTTNSKLVEQALSTSAQDLGKAIARTQYAGLALFYLKSFVLCLVIMPMGIMAVAWFVQMPETLHRAMALYVKLLPLLGAALVVRKLSIKTIDQFLLIGFVVAAVVGQVKQAPALIIIVLVVFAGWFGARYGEQRS
jgi:PTS system mannose-specific IIC component